MKKIRYTPDAADKLRNISKKLILQHGSSKAKEIIGRIMKTGRELSVNEKLGPSVEEMFHIPSDYRYIYVSRNYIFYKIEQEYVQIINLYNEKEDFLWMLFGIDTTLQETLDYWKE